MSLTPDGYTSHTQLYWFFTLPAVRTGLLWKIPLNGTLFYLMILNKLLKLKRPIFPSYYKTIKYKYDFIEMDVLSNKKKSQVFINLILFRRIWNVF